MNFWDGEQIMPRFDTEAFKFIDTGPLLGPIKSFHVERNSNYELVLTTKSNESVRNLGRSENPGRIFLNSSEAKLGSPSGGEGRIYGISTTRTQETHNYQQGTAETTQISGISFIEYHAPSPSKVALTFEWLGNFPVGGLWPTNVDTRDGRRTILGEPPIHFKVETKILTLSRNGIRIVLGGYDVHLAYCGRESDSSDPQPGSIMIVGAPNEEELDKIRNCLSFVFGMPFISLGTSRFDIDHNLVSFRARTASSLDGRAWRLFSLPAAPIKRDGFVDPVAVSRIANALYENYEKYEFRTILWKYWHSLVAPMFMAPAYYGSIIESIQKKYLVLNGDKIDSRIISRIDFRALRRLVLLATKDFQLEPEAKAILTERLNLSNVVTQKVITQRFFGLLDLDMSEIELTAWARRNDAAHGNELPNDDLISLLQETRILKLMLNRAILKIIGGSDLYIDYNAPHFPSKSLKEGANLPKDED